MSFPTGIADRKTLFGMFIVEVAGSTVHAKLRRDYMIGPERRIVEGDFAGSKRFLHFLRFVLHSRSYIIYIYFYR